MNVPKVSREHARQFSGEWLFNGKVAVALDDVAFQFASDFADAVLQAVFARYLGEQEAEKRKLVVAR